MSSKPPKEKIQKIVRDNMKKNIARRKAEFDEKNTKVTENKNFKSGKTKQ
ncbi:hypothetical protein [Candidatus Deianiraea vastatrix]|uniref:Uncharacterized protein n=1 Tax=Candidatus Deianiraea vastatrix TaxID=2163644 RepID=A0A5B8XDF4_9RICK|nr:hypothetical protein [Candidatus Deianiraea vastatrix]QED23389.1 hypothetical protein Deia_00595 [Candidatus Deianiraea vastatrix]